MTITWGKAKQILSKYVGTGGACPTNSAVDLFVREVLDYLLINGTYGSEHKFCFCSYKGCITIPYELETPLKVKVDNEIGTVWDRWFEFHPTKYLEECLPAATALQEDSNYYPTIYSVPEGGARVGVVGTCCENDDTYVIVKGVDPSGRQIITTHDGNQVIGEYLRIRKNELRYTTSTFGRIDEIYKTPTVGYVQCYWVNPATNLKGFLADYSPLEETPRYRRFKLTQACWNYRASHPIVKVSVIGRVRLKPAYADNDLIPFDNTYILNLGGQVINANYNNAPDLAKAKKQDFQETVELENEHKKISNGKPIEVFIQTSGGAIKNII